MTTTDEQNVQGADPFAARRQELLALGKAALAEHPLLMAMATQIRVTDLGLLFTFDSPALPEKQNCEVSLHLHPSTDGVTLAAFMRSCEDQLAAAMRRAGLAWANPSVVGKGGGSSGGGNPSTHGEGGGGAVYGSPGGGYGVTGMCGEGGT